MLQSLALDSQAETLKSFADGEASFRVLMDESQAVAWMKDVRGRYVYVNVALEHLFLVRLDDIRGKTDFDRFTEETARRVREDDQLVLATGRPMRSVEEVPTPDGRVHTWMVVKFPFRGPDGGRLLGGMAVDITELKSLESHLAERLRRADELNSELATANARLRELAATDGLTGLGNYRRFRDALDAAFAPAVRQEKPLSVVMVDVDRFKRYNDSFGHPGGDDVLCTLATILSTTVRGHDLVARYGGEEFMILLPDTDRSGSRVVAERLRCAVERHGWPLRRVTVSVGVATATGATLEPGDLVRQADEALYRSKRQGRNRVTNY